MRSRLPFAALLCLAALPALAQDPLLDAGSGPQAIKPQPTYHPLPDADGVYEDGPGMQSPIVLERPAVSWPADCPLAGKPGSVLLSVVIDAEGHPGTPTVLHPAALSAANPAESNQGDAACDRAALAHFASLKFAPGTIDVKPVPVRIRVRYPFGPAGMEIYPHIARSRPLGQTFGRSPASSTVDQLPKVIRSQPAAFSPQARKEKFQGAVLLSLVVNEQGLPEQVQILKPIGHGLDEKAIEAAQAYRFQPAMKDGHPVPYHLTLEVDFQLY